MSESTSEVPGSADQGAPEVQATNAGDPPPVEPPAPEPPQNQPPAPQQADPTADAPLPSVKNPDPVIVEGDVRVVPVVEDTSAEEDPFPDYNPFSAGYIPKD